MYIYIYIYTYIRYIYIYIYIYIYVVCCVLCGVFCCCCVVRGVWFFLLCGVWCALCIVRCALCGVCVYRMREVTVEVLFVIRARTAVDVAIFRADKVSKRKLLRALFLMPHEPIQGKY